MGNKKEWALWQIPPAPLFVSTTRCPTGWAPALFPLTMEVFTQPFEKRADMTKAKEPENFLTNITKLTPRNDGAFGVLTLHTARKQPMEVVFSPDHMEATTLALLQLSQACAARAELPQSISEGSEIRSRADLRCDGFAVALGDPQRFNLVFRMGVFDLTISLPASELGGMTSALAKVGTRIESDSHIRH